MVTAVYSPELRPLSVLGRALSMRRCESGLDELEDVDWECLGSGTVGGEICGWVRIEFVGGV